MLSYLTPQLMKAYSYCLLGPQSFLACAQERLERVQDESSAAEEQKKNCQEMLQSLLCCRLSRYKSQVNVVPFPGSRRTASTGRCSL